MTINSHIPASFYQSLAKTQPPQQLWIVGYRNGAKTTQLIGMGLAPGTAIEILQRVAGNLVVRIGETRIGLNQQIAEQILVTDQPLTDPEQTMGDPAKMEQTAPLTLKDLQLYQTGKVKGFANTHTSDLRAYNLRAYKKKLLAMGLTPGTEFTVTHIAPLGDPIEIKVRGFRLSLRQAEAALLIVQEVQE
ncbi:ferrous iron transport protein A [Acaryochloris sp. IP29b_bin.137]|uniref:FeoA family protein n=1 Tax=Acaryochloris sp. IP29b_bin.137 TaxID=2969217 RepID=UPI002602BAEF|nr:ferrous iron transport protein A [Acaryochloris sp. IP29b_bin.137]